MKLIILNIFIITVLMVNPTKGQDPHFSQFYSNYLYLAPSFAGLSAPNRLAVNYRNQWPEISPGFVTYSVSFDHDFEKFNSGLGVLLMRDEAGTGRLRSTNIGLQYSYDFKVNERFHIRPGMHFLYTERGLDFDKLLWKDQMSAAGYSSVTAEPYSMDYVGDIDFSTSVLGYSGDFWLGFSVDHLLRPNHSLYDFEEEDGNRARVPLKYQVFGGTKFVAKQKLLQPIPTSLQLAFLFKAQKEYRSLDLGLYWHREPLVLGLWYRGIPVVRSFNNNDALVLLFGYKANNVSVGYSYDFTTSRLITNTQGSHEISMAVTFEVKPRKKRPRIVPCPQF
ncbi:MAG: PorP/SprF family type IX secretion system membrane protein [Bacteroidota bacterium]